MTEAPPSRKWTYAGLACITCGTLVLELSLTRIFSVVMYYHFAFMAISLALFGLGFSGIYLYLRPGLAATDARFNATVWRHTLLAAVAAWAYLAYLLRQKIELTQVSANVGTLAVLYVLAAVPFFCAGMTVSVVVKRFRSDMARLYAFDLGGAGLGCLLLVPLLDRLGGPGTVLAAGLLFVAGHLLLRAGSGGGSLLGWAPGSLLLLGGLTLVGVNAVHPFLRIPSVKEGREESVIFARWNSFSRVTVEAGPSDHLWLRMDSSAAARMFSGEIARQGYQAARRFSETRVASLVYALRRPGPALVIGSGGGADVIAALTFGQKQITAVEINPIIVNDVMLGRFLEYSGRLYQRPEVAAVVAEGRS
jgi:hypothetical protein